MTEQGNPEFQAGAVRFRPNRPSNPSSYAWSVIGFQARPHCTSQARQRSAASSPVTMQPPS
jgi:hypothetical protein